MCAHDAVAQKDFYPHLPDIPVEVDEDEETIKIVQLVKSNEPLVSAPTQAIPYRENLMDLRMRLNGFNNALLHLQPNATLVLERLNENE